MREKVSRTKGAQSSLYKAHPKHCDPNDFWGQVKRTVNGEPVSDEQIRMIVAAIKDGLRLSREDTLLDLCCGNGALTTLVFQKCAGGVGVDFSEPLIKVAKTNFEREGSHCFRLDDVVDFLENEPDLRGYTKILCYGSFPYLEATRAENLLRLCREKVPMAKRLFIGNLPDKARLHQFFSESTYTEGIENESDSAIGIWRTKEEFLELVADTGWQIEFRQMPAEFYASGYRYDVLLSR